MSKQKISLKGTIEELQKVNNNLLMNQYALAEKRAKISTKVDSLNGQLYDMDDRLLSLSKEHERISNYITEMESNDCNCYKISKDGTITYYKVIVGKN